MAAVQGADRAMQRHLGQCFLARQHLVASSSTMCAENSGSARMQVNRCPPPRWPLFCSRQPNPGVETIGRGMKCLIDDPVAAMDLNLVDPASDEIERATLSGMAELGRRVLGMDGAHAGNVPGRRNRKSVADPDGTCEDGSRTTVPAPGNEKLRSTAKRKRPPRGALRQAQRSLDETRFQHVQPLPANDGDRHDLCARKARLREQAAKFGANSGDPFGANPIAFTQRDDAPPDAEQIDDLQVLAGLWHRPVIRSDDQQHEVYPGRSRQHVVNKAFVTGDIHKTQCLGVRHRTISEAEIDRNAARLFRRQSVRIDAGQRSGPARFYRDGYGRRCRRSFEGRVWANSSPTRSAGPISAPFLAAAAGRSVVLDRQADELAHPVSVEQQQHVALSRRLL